MDTPDGRVTTSSVDIDNGSHIVLLNIKDRATGAFKHHQQQVYSSPVASDAETEKENMLV
jgi:hypothetical protein